MDYGKVFSRGWEISWRNKYLFIMGFLAALGAGAGSNRGGSNVNFSFDNPEQIFPPGFEQDIGRFLDVALPLFVGLACVGVFVAIIFWLIRLAAQAGMISAAARIDAGESVSFGQAFSAGTGHLLRMVGINILLYLPLWVIGGVAIGGFIVSVGTAVAAAFTSGAGENVSGLGAGAGVIALCAGLLICLLIPLAIVITLVYPFAQRGAVVQDLGVIDSIRHGWRILTRNLGDVLIIAVLFVVLGIVFSIVVGLILLPLGFLSIGPAVFDLITSQTPDVGSFVLIGVSAFVLGVLGAIFNAILVTYRSVTVTLAYKEFTGKAAKVA